MIWLAFVVSFFKSLAAISEKKVLLKEDARIYASQFSFVIAFVSLPLLFFVKNFDITSNDLLIIFSTSILAVVSSLSSVYVIKKLDFSESSILFSISPVFVTLLSIVFLGELISKVQVFGIAVIALGIFILEKYNTSESQSSMDSVHSVSHKLSEKKNIFPKTKTGVWTLLFISLLAFSVVSILDRLIVHYRGVDPILYLIITQFFNFIIYILVDAYIFKTSKKKIVDLKLFRNKSFWSNIIFIGCHRVAYVYAVAALPISILSTIRQISVVFITIAGGKFFVEKHVIRRTVACVIVVAGIILVVI